MWTTAYRRLSVIDILISDLSLFSFTDQKSSNLFDDSPAFSPTTTLLDVLSITVPRGGHPSLLTACFVVRKASRKMFLSDEGSKRAVFMDTLC